MDVTGEPSGVKRKRDDGEGSSKKKRHKSKKSRNNAVDADSAANVANGNANQTPTKSRKKKKKNRQSNGEPSTPRQSAAVQVNGLSTPPQDSQISETTQSPQDVSARRKKRRDKKKKKQMLESGAEHSLTQAENLAYEARRAEKLRLKKEMKKERKRANVEKDELSLVKKQRKSTKHRRVDRELLEEDPLGIHDSAGFWSTFEAQQATTKASKEPQAEGAWALSPSVGGRFIDAAPILSDDEKHLIAATATAVNVYSTENSTLQRRLDVEMGGLFTAIALSSLDRNLLYAATHTGCIQLWDWTKGTSKGVLRNTPTISRIRTAKFPNTKHREIILTLGKRGSRSLFAQEITKTDDGVFNVVHEELLSSKHPFLDFKVISEAKVIVAVTESEVFIGELEDQQFTSVGDLKYLWRRFSCPESPTSFDARAVTGSSKSALGVDIVLGGVRGCVYVYRSVQVHAPDSKGLPPNVQELHWHREAVTAVSWSQDGNYVISGGAETVLVQWQIDTGRKQFLPHLESPIEDVSVSANGGSYLLRLGDNSVMVLSTAELLPTAHVPGVQSLSTSTIKTSRPEVPTMEIFVNLNDQYTNPTVNACVKHSSTEELIIVVPPHHWDSSLISTAPAAPYIQRYDLTHQRHIQRQAIARTNATNTNLSPEGTRVREPNIAHVQLSDDGNWLLAADEWTPVLQDLKDEMLDTDNPTDILSQRREVNLSFWHWNSSESVWELNSRIMNPHQLDLKHSSGRILAAATSPIDTSFATLGEDSVLRIWTVKSRLANGRIVRGSVPQGGRKQRVVETWWSVRSTIALPQASARDPLRNVLPARACLAYSNDGSCIAVNQYFNDITAPENGIVHFIDSDSAALRDSKATLLFQSPDEQENSVPPGILSIAFLERFLIVLGRFTATVWDVTNFSLHDTLKLPNDPVDLVDFLSHHMIAHRSSELSADPYAYIPPPSLAVNLSSQTFAISTPIPIESNRLTSTSPLHTYTSHLALYSPFNNEGSSEPVFDAMLPRLCLSLLSATGATANKDRDGKKGYVLIDAGANIRQVQPSGTLSKSTALAAAATSPSDDEDVADESILIDEELDAQEGGTETTSFGAELEPAGRAVVRPEQVAEIFDGNPTTHAMPSLKDMFDGVVRLFAPRRS